MNKLNLMNLQKIKKDGGDDETGEHVVASIDRFVFGDRIVFGRSRFNPSLKCQKVVSGKQSLNRPIK